jgi:molybdopterin/thiamine biosynthesis adenylyltransferase
MDERFTRNLGAITQTEQGLLATKRAAIIGCGGLGGFAAEFLARAGLGHISLVDGDVFTAANLNRQLNCLENNLGKSKALETKERLHAIRPGMSAEAYDTFLTEENAVGLLRGHDVIIDALDNIKTRLLLEKTADALKIPFVHGAVEGWNAQVCTVFPGDFILSKLYPPDSEGGSPGVLSFTPAFCASIQAAEALKILLCKDNILRNKLLMADLKKHSFEIIDF